MAKLDLSRAYKQMKVTESSQPLLIINTHLGLFQYTRLPFGIATAPALWPRAMDLYVDYTYYVNCCMICSLEMIYSFHRTSQSSSQLHRTFQTGQVKAGRLGIVASTRGPLS